MTNVAKVGFVGTSSLLLILSIACAIFPHRSNAGSSSAVTGTATDMKFTIATDRPGSTNAQVGEIICNIYNRERPAGAPVCLSAYSPGGPHQMADMRSGRVQMAIMQSDVVAAAMKGEKKFEANKVLRVLLPLHKQVLAATVVDVMSIRDLNIKTLSTLQVGVPSTVRNGKFSLTTLFNDLGISAVQPPHFQMLGPAEQMTALCEGRIDIGFAILGHPNGAIQQGIHNCQVTLIPFDFPALRQIVEQSSHWHMGKIRENTYVRQTSMISAPAVTALLMTTKFFDRKTGDTFTRILKENQDVLRRLHRALSDLDFDKQTASLRKLKLFGQD